MDSSIPGPIKTIVVLVMENRSFDTMLGWMKTLNPEIDGVTGQEFNYISSQDPTSQKIFFKDTESYVDPDPGHSFGAIREQVFGESKDFDPYPDPAPMSGFAQNAEKTLKGMSTTVMNGFKPDSLPVYKALVSEYAVFDRWFASVPASTQPNRLFVHSATSLGATSNDTKKLLEGFPQKTIFESVYESGLDFAIYWQYPPSTLFYRNLRKLKYIVKFKQYDLHFKADAKNGKLPNYVVVEQRYFDLKILPGNDDHPSHDVSQGQKFVKEVYEILRGSPQWNEMLFIITYDEHGGFYDHYPTPVKGVPSPDDIIGPAPYYFKFDRLGVRVPTIMISPWIEKGTVVHGPPGPYPTSQYEHSSIPATVKKIFNLKSDYLTKRDAWAGTFDHILSIRDTPRTDCPEKLPLPVKLRVTQANEKAPLNDFQKDLVVMAARLGGKITGKESDSELEEKVDKMCVKDGSKFAQQSMERFFKGCDDAMKDGCDDSEIVIPPCEKDKSGVKELVDKLFSCVACKHK